MTTLASWHRAGTTVVGSIQGHQICCAFAFRTGWKVHGRPSLILTDKGEPCLVWKESQTPAVRRPNSIEFEVAKTCCVIYMYNSSDSVLSFQASKTCNPTTCTGHLWKVVQDIDQAFTISYNRYLHIQYTYIYMHIRHICSTWSADVPCFCYGISGKQSWISWSLPGDPPYYSRHEAGDTTWRALALRMTVLQNASLYHIYTKGYKGISFLFYFTSFKVDEHWGVFRSVHKKPFPLVAIQWPALSLVSPVCVSKDLHESVSPSMREVVSVAETWRALSLSWYCRWTKSCTSWD